MQISLGRLVSLRTLFGVLVLALVMAACGTDPAPDEPGAEPGDPDVPADVPVVRIGFPIPLSGGGAAIGNRFNRAQQIAIDELNEEAGGSMVFQGIPQDSGCAPEAAATAAFNLIVRQDVHAMVGELCSSATLAVKDLAEEHGVPLVVPNSSALPITGPDHEWTFRIIPHEVHQNIALANVAYDYFNHESFVVAFEQTDAGVGGADAFIDAFEAKGGTIVESMALDREAPDYTPVISRIASLNPEAIHLTMLIEASVRFVQAMEEQGLDIPVYSTIWLAFPLFEDTAGSAADNNIRQLFYINTSDFPPAAQFTETYNEWFPDAEPPDFNHAQFYAGVKLVGHAAMECGASREQIRDCIRDVEGFESPIGPFTFDDEGQVIPTPDSLLHIETQGGQVEVLDDRDDFVADDIYVYGE